MSQKMHHWLNFIIVMNVVCLNSGFIASHYRERRTFLAYNDNGTVKLVLGVNIPIILADSRRSLNKFFNVQMQYLPPPQPLYEWSIFNSTTFPYNNKRYQRAKQSNYNIELYKIDRSTIYTYLKAIWQNLEPFDSQDCLLRFLCDVAQYPFDINTLNQNHNLYHHLLNALFTPRSEDDNSANVYLQARQAGLSRANCKETFPMCTDIYDIAKRFTRAYKI